MLFRDLLGFSFAAFSGHRLRTGLSLGGVAVGIAAVITLTALGEGARRYVSSEFEALGAQTLIIIPGRVETTGAIPFGGTTHDLSLADVEFLRNRLPRGVLRVAPLSTGTETLHYRGHSRSIPVLGATSEFQAVRRLEIAAGSFLPPGDLQRGGSGIVLGSKVVRELFPGENPLGRIVRLGSWRFRVVGVLKPRGRSLGFDMDDLAFIPVQSCLSLFNRHSLFRILVEVDEASAMPAVKQELEELFYRRHRARDVTVLAQDAIVDSFSSILGVMTLALAGIASISLIVAGLGIMNVMLVAVSERKKEIGLLKALGARRHQIVGVFLAEAFILSFLGGLAGVALGMAAVSMLIRLYPSFPAWPPTWAFYSAIATALGVGLLFGAWPARQASRLDPVTALGKN